MDKISRRRRGSYLAALGLVLAVVIGGLSLGPSWLSEEMRPVLANYLVAIGLFWFFALLLWGWWPTLKSWRQKRREAEEGLRTVEQLEADVNQLRAERRQKIPEIVVQFDHLERSGFRDSWRVKKIDQLADEVHRTLPESIRGNWEHRITVAKRRIAEVADGVKPIEDLREHVRVFAELASLENMIKRPPNPEHSKE